MTETMRERAARVQSIRAGSLAVKPVRERWVDCDGTWVHTADWQPADPAPGAAPILLVHGLGGCTVNWELVGQSLADELGTGVTAVDLPGFGRTRADTHAPLFPRYVELLAAFLDGHPPTIVMVVRLRKLSAKVPLAGKRLFVSFSSLIALLGSTSA